MRYCVCLRCLLLFTVISTGAACSIARAQPAGDPAVNKTEGKLHAIAPPTEKELADQRLMFMKSALARFTVQVGDQKEEAKVGEPCLRLSNPVSPAAVLDGIFSVYSHNKGRPAATVKFFHNSRGWVTVFTPIPESDIKIQRSGSLFWKPSEPVGKFADLPNSPVPAATPGLRLTQMRAIAADFSTIGYIGLVNHNLRLLTQPVYRYSERGEILDGALFVFVLGTDPHCCLLLEAYQRDKSSRYRFALAPTSLRKMETRFKDSTVWDIEFRPTGGSGSYLAQGYKPDPGEKVPIPVVKKDAR